MGPQGPSVEGDHSTQYPEIRGSEGEKGGRREGGRGRGREKTWYMKGCYVSALMQARSQIN